MGFMVGGVDVPCWWFYVWHRKP